MVSVLHFQIDLFQDDVLLLYTFGFAKFSRGIETEYWLEMSHSLTPPENYLKQKTLKKFCSQHISTFVILVNPN